MIRIHSAIVVLTLIVDDREIALSHTCSTYVRARNAVELPPGTRGEVVIFVDGRRSAREVILPCGMSSDLDVAPIVFADTIDGK